MQNELTQAFQEIDEQISQNVKLKLRQIEERQRKGTDRGQQIPLLAIPALEESDFSLIAILRIVGKMDVTGHCTEFIQIAPILRSNAGKIWMNSSSSVERSTITMNRKMSFSIYLHRSFHPKQVTPTEVLQRFPVVSVFWNNI